MISAKIVKDSISSTGSRITTFVLTYPRFIHAEFMTHRMFSRNASSSRAIPVKKQIQMVMENPAIPIAFTKNKPGMQGGELSDDRKQHEALLVWHQARDIAVDCALKLADLEVHKQHANRILEPFAHITVVCTATDYANFFALRLHPAAQPEICELARQMYECYRFNMPQFLKDGEWHLPFVEESDVTAVLMDDLTMKKIENFELPDETQQRLNLIKMSVARCARVSYLTHEGKNPTLVEDQQLYDRLVGSQPIHASPAEHQAMAISDPNVVSGNFKGWIQYRKTLVGENIKEFKPQS